VRFHPVEIVRAEIQGVWVRGLPDTARIITIGQGFVRAGEQVTSRPADAAGMDTAASRAEQAE
jgi:multidrug efflux system membrane fusion protein